MWQGFHTIVVLELIYDVFEQSNLLHVRDLVEDIPNLLRELKGWSNLCEDQNVSGWAAQGENIVFSDGVEGDKTEVVHLGNPLLSSIQRHVH